MNQQEDAKNAWAKIASQLQSDLAAAQVKIKEQEFDCNNHTWEWEKESRDLNAKIAALEAQNKELEHRIETACWCGTDVTAGVPCPAHREKIERLESSLALAKEAYNNGWYSCADVPPYDHKDICWKCLECLSASLPAPDKEKI